MEYCHTSLETKKGVVIKHFTDKHQTLVVDLHSRKRYTVSDWLGCGVEKIHSGWLIWLWWWKDTQWVSDWVGDDEKIHCEWLIWLGWWKDTHWVIDWVGVMKHALWMSDFWGEKFTVENVLSFTFFFAVLNILLYLTDRCNVLMDDQYFFEKKKMKRWRKCLPFVCIV